MADVKNEELNLNGFDGPFTGQIGNFQDYSRDFLVKLVKVYDDCTLYSYHAWATSLARHVGEEQAWELAGEIQRGVGRQILPFSAHGRSEGPAWPDGLTVTRFDLTADKLSKEALVELCRVYQDRYFKMGNYWLDKAVNLVGLEKMGDVFITSYNAIGAHIIPKLCKIANFEIKSVVDAIKVANMTLDGNRSFGGDWEVVDENNVKLHMRRCMIIDEYVPQGVYGLGDQFDGTKMWEFNCRHEAMGASAFLPGVQLDIRLPRIDLKFEEGEAYCVWTYCKKDPNNPAHKAPTCHSPCGTCKM